MADTPSLDAARAAILAATLEIAAEEGWPALRLHKVADRAGLELSAVGALFPDVDAITNAWFGAARLHLLALPWESIRELPADRRLAAAMRRWLAFFGPDRSTATAIIRAKLHPSHVHHWAPLVFDLSRLVHDFLDVARVPGEGRRRAVQEMALTAITLAMLADWACDRSPELATTEKRLGRRLRCAGCLARLPRRASA